MHTIPVHVPAAEPYDIIIRPGVLANTGLVLRSRSGASKACIITDSNVGPLYLEPILASLKKAEFEPVVVTVPAGEDQKTTVTVAKIYDMILPARIDRNTPILALGGGVVCDMAGFVAATVLRGLPLVQMPTTLLSMVDASIGGKTGVNHQVGKNLIGAFHQPMGVFIDPQVLKTLPPRELRSGLAECIKHEIIRDEEGFTKLERNIHRTLELDIDYLTELVAHNVAIKARVVEADPFEKAERAHLNFGHTFGHAIERVSNYSYAHGECVALGMVAASYVAMKLGMIRDDVRQRIVSLIAKAELPTGKLTLDVDTVIASMGFDKKVKSGKLRFILPDRIGHVVIRDDVPPQLVREAVESMR